MRLIFLFMFSVLIVLTGCQKDPVNAVVPDKQAQNNILLSKDFIPQGVTVMTRNIYVGTDVDVVLGATDPSEIPGLVAEAFAVLEFTDFPARAELLVNEIEAVQPHLIGLQEISLIRHQSPGDMVIGGTIPAEEVLYDYLAILMEALQARGLNYEVAGMIQNADVELPMFAGMGPEGPLFDDVRLTDFDVVLVRSDVKVISVRTANYKAMLEVPAAGISVPRGYVIADVKIDKRKYCFVNTHLEQADQLLPIQMAQAQELLKKIHQWGKPIILVGDFNSVAPYGETYQFIMSQGYADAWLEANPNENGFTFGHDYNLVNQDVEFDERIDFVFVRNKHNAAGIGPVIAEVVGDEQENRTPPIPGIGLGLWPSDHGGVIAQLELPVGPKYLAFE
jgi:hypothetical protein